MKNRDIDRTAMMLIIMIFIIRVESSQYLHMLGYIGIDLCFNICSWYWGIILLFMVRNAIMEPLIFVYPTVQQLITMSQVALCFSHVTSLG